MKKQHPRIGRIDLMQNFSFFEVAEGQAADVTVEIAGEESGRNGRAGKGGKKGYKKESNISYSKNKPPKNKPSREERGYAARGPKKKDDWQQLMKGEEPDFSEEGWARRKKKK